MVGGRIGLLITVMSLLALFGFISVSPGIAALAGPAVPDGSDLSVKPLRIAFTTTEIGVAQGAHNELQRQGAISSKSDKNRARKRKGQINRNVRKRQKRLDDVLKDRYK